MFAPHLLPAVLPDRAEGTDEPVSGNRAERVVGARFAARERVAGSARSTSQCQEAMGQVIVILVAQIAETEA
jgi:hypothetical protein